jgi:hypothetical protein
MTPNDIAEAAERRRNGGSTLRDTITLADAYLSLTDPTPLTVEKLVEKGAILVGEDRYWLPGGVFVTIDRIQWMWWLPGTRCDRPIDSRLSPRSVGELNMLLKMMEGRG